jgi:putative redox protein
VNCDNLAALPVTLTVSVTKPKYLTVGCIKLCIKRQPFYRELVMNARIKWVQDVMFVAESGSGHAIVLDGAPAGGGRNMGMRPMELMALGVGSCSSYDVVTILKKARQEITSCEAEIIAERVDTTPSTFESIHLHFIVAGKNLSEKQVAKAIELSADKYCSASIMMKNAGVKVSHDFEIVDSAAASAS